jgi:two-component system, NtrC family, nitrogen regulation response regulator NtrX
VCGAPGTGRSAVARAVHAASAATRPGAFVAVDCAELDADQLDQKLFGVAARQDEALPVRELERISQRGAIAEAARGTLYLRHLAEAPTRVQRRLARVLRDREAILAETGVLVSVDMRCIGSADLTIADDAVVPDLHRRLSSTRIDVPPLCERREDIPTLANALQRAIAAETGKPAPVFSRSALALIGALPWTGNAGELRRVLQRILGALTGRGIGVEDVLAQVRIGAGAVQLAHGGTLRQARAQFEQQYIAATLRQHRGRIAQAARALGIQRTNLYRKMRTLNLSQARH